MITKISEAFEVFFYAQKGDLKSVQIHAAIEGRDVGTGLVVFHSHGVVIDSAVA